MAAVVLELDEDGAWFRHGAEEREADGQLDTLLDQRASGSLSEKKFHLALADLVEHYPNYIDGHAHLGFVMLERGKAKQALDACERGLVIGLAAIPRTYRGPHRMVLVGNRPLLRAVRGVALCYQKLGRRDQTIEILEHMLRWNPSDN